MGRASKRQRSHADTADEQRLIKAAFAKVKAEVRNHYKVDPSNVVEFAQLVYCTLIELAANHEENMRKAGVPVPKLVEYNVKEHIGRNGGDVEAAFVHCKRCIFRAEHKDGNPCCSIKKEVTEGKDGEITMPYYVSNYDGCSKGIMREEYR